MRMWKVNITILNIRDNGKKNCVINTLSFWRIFKISSDLPTEETFLALIVSFPPY